MLRSAAALLSAWLLTLPLAPFAGSDRQTPAPASLGWPQWGGPTRDFHAPAAGLAEAWPESGPRTIWSRPLGTGHSAIAAAGGRLFTMYRAGDGRGRRGPWADEETVVALDAATGKTIWEHTYPARTGFEDFSFGPGPHATPLVVGERVFTLGTNHQLFAFDSRTGKVLWSHDLVKDFKAPELLLRPNVKVGHGCSPIAFGDTIICSVGGPGQSVMAFRQSDGAVAWKSGDFLTSAAAPILIEVGGRPQLVVLGGASVNGLDPATGAVLWSHPHDPGNDLNCSTPLFGADGIVFVSSAYQAGSRAIQLTERDGLTHADELWFTSRVRFMFLGAIRIGEFVYGTTGDFGPAFLTAVNVRTGEPAWQARGFARASLLRAGDTVIVLTEDGDLALTRLSPTGVAELARAKIFETTSWTAPTLVGTTLYARDREKIVALDLRPGTPPAGAASRADGSGVAAGPTTARTPSTPPASLAGSWQFDAAGSTVADGAGFGGVAAAGAPPWLFVTQPANGTLVVESALNTSRARFYRPGGATTTDVANGSITMTSAWRGGSLVAEGRIDASSGERTPVRETFSRAGDALVVEIAAGDRVSRLRYVPLLEVGPCTSWPRPCKKMR